MSRAVAIPSYRAVFGRRRRTAQPRGRPGDRGAAGVACGLPGRRGAGGRRRAARSRRTRGRAAHHRLSPANPEIREKLASDMAQAVAQARLQADTDRYGRSRSGGARRGARLVVIAATWGEGEPPGRAARVYAELMKEGAPRLDGVEYGVLALGDTAYAEFCAVGKRIDERLAELGAKARRRTHRLRSRLRRTGRQLDRRRAESAGAAGRRRAAA